MRIFIFGLALSLLAIAGAVAGVAKRNRPLIAASAVALLLVIAVWVSFYLNPS